MLNVCSGKGSAYRDGGDELCVLLPNFVLDKALSVRERFRPEVSAISTEEPPTGLSTSLGIACFPGSTADPTKLLSLADAAMYDSKRAGGNRVSKAEEPDRTFAVVWRFERETRETRKGKGEVWTDRLESELQANASKSGYRKVLSH